MESSSSSSSSRPSASGSSSRKRKASDADNSSDGPLKKSARAPNPFQQFLNDHRDPKKELATTNTRIPISDKKYSGGRWHIPDNELEAFLELYRTRVLSRGQVDRLTECHRTDGRGPILIDFDFKYPVGTEDRLVDDAVVENLVDVTLEELALAYEFEADTAFNVFVLQKENIVPHADYVKDGVHLLITIQADKVAQRVLRLQSLPRMEEAFSELPFVNSWDSIYDEDMSKGTAPWPLYGSRKPPAKEAYLLTRHFEITVSDSGFQREELEGFKESDFLERWLHLLSARNTRGLVELPTTVPFTDLCVQMLEADEEKKQAALSALTLAVNSCEMDLTAFSYNADLMINLLLDCESVEEIDNHYQEFLNACEIDEFDLVSVSKYVMLLGPEYYEPGSYTKRSNICWTLRCISPKLLVTWIRFMFRRETPDFDRMSEWIDMWKKTKCTGNRGSCIGSLKSKAKAINEAAVARIDSECIDFYINASITPNGPKNGKNIMGHTHSDLAKLLHFMFERQFVCVNLTKNGDWYQFLEHRWQPVAEGTTLRSFIDNVLRPLFFQKHARLSLEMGLLEPDDPRQKILKDKMDTLGKIIKNLGSSSTKDNIMKECKHLFYDKDFLSLLDSKESYSLVCFKNGVVDIETGEFRPGRPEDYISVCTKQNYLEELRPEHDKIIKEIERYMHRMFPINDVCENMWEMLSVILHGDVTQNQIMFYLHGEGQNGKGIFTEQLLPKLFGEYFGTINRNFYLQESEKIGGTNTDVADMIGKRCVVSSEFSTGAVLCEAPFKQATSGTDEMKGRRVYATATTKFFSQFVPIVSSNNFIGVKTTDRGTWRRIAVINCIAYFTRTPNKNKPYEFKRENVSKKMANWYEVFLHLLVKRVVANQGKITLCDTVIKDTLIYRKSQDDVAEFVYDNVIRDDLGTLSIIELNCRFKEWMNQMKGVQHRGNYNNLHKYVTQYFDIELQKFYNNWPGVRLRVADDPIEAGNDVTPYTEQVSDDESVIEDPHFPTKRKSSVESDYDSDSSSVADADPSPTEESLEYDSGREMEYATDSDSVLRVKTPRDKRARDEDVATDSLAAPKKKRKVVLSKQ